MSELSLLNESTVLDSEIDSLGHMNVRYYLARLDEANRELLSRVGVQPATPAVALRRIDTYSRFHREQFAGAQLETSGGFLAPADAAFATAPESLQAYFEIRNPQTQALAASFLVMTQQVDLVSQAGTRLPELDAMLVQQLEVAVPIQGGPRSLSLATPKRITLDELNRVISDEPTPGMMSGRRQSQVFAEDCDELGRLREDLDLMFVIHRPQPGENVATVGPPVMKTADGRRYSWAMMETRAVVAARPCVGDKVVSLGADIAFSQNWRQSRRWMFVADSGELLGTMDTLGVCIDLDARRAMAMPEDVLATVQRNSLPQLA